MRSSDYKMKIMFELIEQNPKLEKMGILDLMNLVDRLLSAQKVVDEKIKKSCH